MSIPTPSQIIPNYCAALSMKDDNDDITIVTFNVTQSKDSDDATSSTASISDDDMTDDEEVPTSLPY